MSNRKTLFVGSIIGIVVCLAISVYYIVPGYYHILTTHDYTSWHPTHAFAFFALAVICVIVALVTRPRAAQASIPVGKEEHSA